MADIDRASPVIKLFGMVISRPEKQESNDLCLKNLAPLLDTDTDDAGGHVEVDATESPGNDVNPTKAAALPCPRCNSMETKFCYFNNYNVNQPRHFCRTCNRYWTAGGSLRNIPFGSGRSQDPRFVIDY